MHYITSMSYSDSLSTLFFDDCDVSDFLERYSDLCEDCDIDEAEKCWWLPHYCKSSIETYIETSLKWVNSNWVKLIKTLQKKYKTHNLEQQIRSQEFLKIFKNKLWIKKDNLKQYCQQFIAISDALIKQNLLDSYTQELWFLKELSSQIDMKMILKCDINLQQSEIFALPIMI